MRHSSVIWLVLVVAVICPAVLAEDTPSPAVKRILDKAVGKVRANRTEFDKANEKPLSEARQELQDLSTKLIKDGKTEEAKAVLGQVGTLETDVMRIANAPMPVARGAESHKPILERLQGRWQRHRVGMMVIEKDRIVDHKGEGAMLKPISQNIVEAVWRSGTRWHLQLADENIIAIREWTSNGQPQSGVVLERIK